MRLSSCTFSSASFARRFRSSEPTPAYTSGSSTLCSAVARGSRLNVWKTNPISLLRTRAERVVGHRRDQLAVEPVLAGVRRVETADDVHERRLAGARRSHDRDVLVAADGEIDAAQRADDFAAHVVFALDAARDDDPLRIRRLPGAANNDLPLGGFAERCFYGVVGSRLGPRGGLLRVGFRLAHQRAVLELANRLVGAGDDLVALLETARGPQSASRRRSLLLRAGRSLCCPCPPRTRLRRPSCRFPWPAWPCRARPPCRPSGSPRSHARSAR